MYSGSPLVWKYKLQTEITLSSMELEYTVISYALIEVIPIIQLLKELKREVFSIESTGK